MAAVTLLDCTLRDGGYYNAWDFDRALIEDYLAAMAAARIDVVEMGFRFLGNAGFKGPCAYTTDDFLRGFAIPPGLTVAVMVNGADLCTPLGREAALARLFPEPAAATPVSLVRFACHYHEIATVMPAVGWLADRGYRVGFNLMQISDRTEAEMGTLAAMAADWPVEVLYVADSMGSMTPDDTARVIGWMRSRWDGPIGVHTHDNMGLALSNTLRAVACGATWLDATVTGMGRGPGNARTEELAIEAEALRGARANLVPLMGLIRRHFGPMKARHGWGTNPYYYLAGRYGIHPTYIQEMLADARYGEEDILAVIEHLRDGGGKKFDARAMRDGRNLYRGAPEGGWAPAEAFAGREVLLLGTGPGAARHRAAIEAYVRHARPVVLALNTQAPIDEALIDLRIACHPVRLLADAETHARLPQPLITPWSMLPEGIRAALAGKVVHDFGLAVEPDRFAFHATHCVAPSPLVLAYALAAATSGGAARILMAGFDGYPPGDPRNDEINRLLHAFAAAGAHPPLCAITPSIHDFAQQSVYGLLRPGTRDG